MIRVLVAEDQHVVRDGLCRVLHAYDDITVVGDVATGDEAIQRVAETVPDVVLMDVEMPGMGGVAATEIVCSTYPSVHVLMLTGHAEFVVPALRAGAGGYMLKDTSPDEMVEAIRKVAAGQVVLDPSVLPQVVAHTREDRPQSNLTERELTVLPGVAAGRTNFQIGQDLGVSESTVKKLVRILMAKLGAQNRAELVHIAQRKGLL